MQPGPGALPSSDENVTPNSLPAAFSSFSKMTGADVHLSCTPARWTEDIWLSIMRHCSWEIRAHILVLTRQHKALLLEKDGTWRDICRWLAEESFLYVPDVLCDRSWRSLFSGLYPSRNVFTEPGGSDAVGIELLKEALSDEEGKDAAAATPAAVHKFKIMVCARMKPLPKLEVAPTPFSDGSSRVKDVGASVVLPLHQRLSLIRAAHKCSKAEARRILWQGDANSADPSAKPDPWADAGVKSLDLPDGPATGEAPAASGEDGASPGEDGDASAEDEAMQACVVNVTKGRDGSVLMCCPGTGLREFAFDAVLGETSSQADVYDAAPRRLVADFLNGRNACIFAYGQTGSGKTHTMFGPDLASGCAVGALSDAGSGIVPRSCSEVMAALEWRRARGGVAADLQVSYVEIYGEQVTDLLRDGAPVGLWHGVAHRAVYTGDCAQGVGSAAELRALLLRGDEAKRRAATAMNERSSRAHALLLLSLRQLHAPSGVEVWSSLCLADLGGSEKVLKSEVASMTQQAGGYHEADVRLREAVNINLGLLALKSCIKALNDGGGAYVPYQNSRLTMMLSAALGGDCRTAVVVTGSGERRHAVETMHALRFGEDCAKVATTAGADSLAAARRAIRALDSEIEEVEAAIRAKERWETRRRARVDERHQAGEALAGTEVVSVSVLVGAEAERNHLEVLLARRKILGGR